MTQIVYLLGAGASRSIGGPLVADFRSRAGWAKDTLINLPDEPRYAAMDLALQKWDEVQDLDIEDFYVYAELQHMLGADDDQTILKAVQFMIHRTVTRRPAGDDGEAYRSLTNAIMSAPRNHTVVTLNWDVALDGLAPNHPRRPVVDYGFSASEVVDESGMRAGIGPPLELLKLHGSVHWLVCPECNRIHVLSHQEEASNVLLERSRRCTQPCGGVLEPLFVPPTMQKLGPGRGLRPLARLWRKAAERLASCTSLIIAGYSFPPNDKQIRHLVRQALARNSHLTDITIVSDRKLGAAQVEFEGRYGEVFRTPSLRDKLHFQYQTFEDYVVPFARDWPERTA